MKKSCIFFLSLILVLSGCVHKKVKDKKTTKRSNKKTKIAQNIDIPLASDEMISYFDDKDDFDLGEFSLVADENNDDLNLSDSVDSTGEITQTENAIHLDENDFDDFSWVQESENKDENFKKCHFEFDECSLKEDQEENIEENIKLAQEIIKKGDNPTIVIEGHSCHSAGSMTYNLILSEKRAKSIADRFVEAGVPSQNIKLVPRGQEFPERDEFGNVITGSRQDQWKNRRGVVKVVYS